MREIEREQSREKEKRKERVRHTVIIRGSVGRCS